MHFLVNRKGWRAALAAALCATALGTPAQALPPGVSAALARAKIPQSAISMLVVDAQGQGSAKVSHRADAMMNPASVMKLVTTYAALDLLGPAYTWATPVYLDGTVRDGTLYGNLIIQGQGDPKLVQERLWLLLHRVQGLGIRSIAGDIILDHSAFDVPASDPGAFDGEPLKPYNAAPDALLINFKSVTLTLLPLPGAAVARVQLEPPMAGVQIPATVPLLGGDCGDYRSALKADFSDPNRIRLAGGYPSSCGEKTWPVAYVDPISYAPRAVQGLWQDMGGTLTGRVRWGTVPTAASTPGALDLQPAWEMRSAPLAETIRDINKYSNNVMAQQVFLTLGRSAAPPKAATGTNAGAAVPFDAPPLLPGTFASARAAVLRWWAERLPGVPAPVLDNGAGLSRDGRISALALARLLQTAYASPLMPELMSSLPITGVDGTLRKGKARAVGNAHLKTGSLNEVVAVAGYVHGAGGKRWVLVAIVNHPNARAARPAIDALIDWTADLR